MKQVFRTIRDYILWSHERGSVQYDIMVTLILLFLFFSPHFINYGDKPVGRNPHPTGVVVLPGAGGEFIYQIEASAISGNDATVIQSELLRVIEPISGAVSISHYEPVRDKNGQLVRYNVWVQRQQ
jgi:hypothetical protein